ncbi:MAG: NAD-dependent epimerase/dehydratase family protein [Thaumarchaeota archaeon]|nr:NAD-dependent epimerase/dehydratase family protein [Nitrososphaerota archaeon]MCL5318580.1 NAD-dependent epimerase/dehydratase family protein [Nitrososphaerota archaeon]
MGNFYNGKFVCVTGASGMNGSYVVKTLVEQGAKVRAVVHERPSNEYTKMADKIVKKNLMVLSEAHDAVRGVDIVIHTAGITGGVPLAVNDPGALVAPNAVINSQVIHACAKEKVERLGFTSSTVVYPPLERPVKEEEAWIGDPYPLYYGISWVKRFSEKICRYYGDTYGLKVAVVRPSGIYGRYDNFNENSGHVLPAFIQRALKMTNPFVVWGDGKDVRDFLHASDFANGILLATEKYAVNDPINIASGQAVTTGELAETVLKAAGSKAKVKYDPSKPTALKVRMIDISKAKKLLGYEPKTPLLEGIQDTINWYKDTYN